MDLDTFAGQIEALHQRVGALYEQSRRQPDQRAVLEAIFAELATSLVELRASDEELHAQQQELLATQQVLAAHQQRYQALFEQAPDAYLITNAAGLIQAANRAAATLLNRDVQALQGWRSPRASSSCMVGECGRRASRDRARRLLWRCRVQQVAYGQGLVDP